MDNIWENKKKILSGVKNLIIKNKVIEELDTTFPTLVKKMKKYGLERK